MKSIAIYGKGGIGKSTISANISAVLAKKGLSIMQIGCDPKHDSTLLLKPGIEQTVLEIVTENNNYNIDDLVFTGTYGIKCVEFGGPQPGVGCAGRGIIRGISILQQEGVLSEEENDCIIYDVLGDVVCGGFFEPLKSRQVDTMYVVTSGEFNSLFAANNLCKGYVSGQINKKGIKFGGIIGNCRGIASEEDILNSFAKRIKVPFIGVVPRDTRIEKSTYIGEPVVKLHEGTDVSGIFEELANKVYLQEEGTYAPEPITLEELRELYNEFYDKEGNNE